jgi:hypothetical protein
MMFNPLTKVCLFKLYHSDFKPTSAEVGVAVLSVVMYKCNADGLSELSHKCVTQVC